MKKLTKLLALLAVLALIAVACGDDDETTEAAGTDDASAEETAESEPADDDTADDASDDDMAEDDTADDEMAEDEAAAADAAAGAEAPQRIVSIDPSGTEILYAIGAGDRVVAVDSFSYFPEGTPVTDLSAFSPNVESILTFEPDLVVMGFNEEVQAGLEAAGVTVANSFAPTTFDELYAQFGTIAAVTGNEEEAAAVVDGMRTAIDAAIADAPDATGVTFYHELDNTLYSVTSATFIGAVYGLFGLENAADPADADGTSFGYPQLNDEYLVDADPDLIFLADTVCCGVTAETLAERPGWDQLTAVENGNVIELNDDVVSRWGPRIVEFVEAIAGAVEDIG